MPPLAIGTVPSIWLWFKFTLLILYLELVGILIFPADKLIPLLLNNDPFVNSIDGALKLLLV